MTDIFKNQLYKAYDMYLRSYILGRPFERIVLRGGKQRPDSTISLHESIRFLNSLEKKEGKLGWTIEWETWKSKKLGNQQWPVSICVQKPEDLLYLIDKQNEFVLFSKTVSAILNKKPELRDWLSASPELVLNYRDHWFSIFSVIDFLINNDLSGYYLRNIPVPVHTKFIETNKSVILSLLRFLAPTRFDSINLTFEETLGIKQKPYLFTIRWLDKDMAKSYLQGIEVFGLSAEELRKQNWQLEEIWVVENETALYMLPTIKGAFVICSKGKALSLLGDIPMFSSSKLYYWGDLDEEGFSMLNDFRSMYPHTTSRFMNLESIQSHIEHLEVQPKFYRKESIPLLNSQESAAFDLLVQKNGRLEQEKILQSFVVNQIN